MRTYLKQFTKVYHLDYGKGHITATTIKGLDALYMVYFPSVQEHDWVLHSRLASGSDDLMSLKPMEFKEERVSDDLQQALNNLFFGGQPD
jgi:hypothetical protein